MLLSLTIRNYRSFQDEAVLDLQRRRFNTLHPRNGETWRQNTWRRAAVFGANASGKSNFLRPLGRLNQAFQSSLADESALRELCDPHLRSIDKPTFFELEYMNKGVRYRWSLTLDRKGIVEETMFANPESHWRKVFSRSREEISFGWDCDLSAAAKENISQFMRPWALTLTAWRTVKTQGKYASALAWWQKLLPLIYANESDQNNRHKWLIKLVKDDRTWLHALRTILAAADVGIDDIGIEELAPDSVRQIQFKIDADGKTEISETLEESEIRDYLRYILFIHRHGDGEFSLPEHQESQGTKTWMDLAIPALYALAIGGVLAVDEIDGSLHPMLVRELVSYFDSEELNPLGAQLLFSTHDLTLLGKHPVEALERGEVWLVEKVDSCSELIALDEFPVRDAHNIEKRYLQGRYGAVPVVNSTELRIALDKLRDDFLPSVTN